MSTSAAWKPAGTFTHYWFANLTAELWSRYILPRKAAINSYLEVGVSEGMSMLWVLEHLLRDNPGGLAVGIDVFTPARNWHVGEGDEHRDRALANVGGFYELPLTKGGLDPGDFQHDWWYKTGIDAQPSCEIHKGDSRDLLRYEERRFDMVYIDGGHDAEVALPDIVNGFRLLNSNGIFVIDDVERKMRGARPQVQLAVDAFERCYEGYYDPLYEHAMQKAYVKRPKRRRGQYPPILEAGPVIKPRGPINEETEPEPEI